MSTPPSSAAKPIAETFARLAFPLLLVCLSGPIRAEDVIVFRSDGSAGETRVSGEILEYTGRAIRIRAATGLERSYPADRVETIQSDWLTEHEAADAVAAEGDYRRAIQQYRTAIGKEPRLWVRQKILAELVWCYRAVDEVEPASEMFLLLVSSDPTTPYFDSVPLAWTPGEAVPRAKAAAWMDRKEMPAAVLLGASHMLSTDRRPAALDALRRLTTSDDPRLAALAEAQIWRTLVSRASPDQADAWARMIEKMPAAVRGGPYFLLGQALAQQGRNEAAALALLQVPILHARDRQLAAAALVAAGDALAAEDRRDDAGRLYQEVVSQHPESTWKSEAQSRLDRLHAESE